MTDTNKQARVGMLGLGNMGFPMAKHLLNSSFVSSLNIHGRTRAKTAELEDLGANWCASAKELAQKSDMILSVLPDLPQLEILLEGEEGVLNGISHLTTLVICSTSSPQGVRDLADKLGKITNHQLRVLDAPLSGGADGAEKGSLSIMVGGDQALFNDISPVLDACGTSLYMGALGAGQVTKACNQLIVASTINAMSEATLIAQEAGIDLDQLFKALSGGYAGSRLMESRKDRLIHKDYTVSGAAWFLCKDLGFATKEASQHQVYTPQLDTLLKIFEAVKSDGLGDKDMSVVQKWLESKTTASK